MHEVGIDIYVDSIIENRVSWMRSRSLLFGFTVLIQLYRVTVESIFVSARAWIKVSCKVCKQTVLLCTLVDVILFSLKFQTVIDNSVTSVYIWKQFWTRASTGCSSKGKAASNRQQCDDVENWIAKQLEATRIICRIGFLARGIWRFRPWADLTYWWLMADQWWLMGLISSIKWLPTAKGWVKLSSLHFEAE